MTAVAAPEMIFVKVPPRLFELNIEGARERRGAPFDRTMVRLVPEVIEWLEANTPGAAASLKEGSVEAVQWAWEENAKPPPPAMFTHAELVREFAVVRVEFRSEDDAFLFRLRWL